MGKLTTGGASLLLAVLVFSQRLGNYENKPLALILAVGAIGFFLWFGIQLIGEGVGKLKVARESGDKSARNKVYTGFVTAALAGALIAGALIWSPTPAPSATPQDNSPSGKPQQKPPEEKQDPKQADKKPPSTKKAEAKAKPEVPPSVGSINQTCGVVQVGGVGNNNVNCGPPEPQISWHEEISQRAMNEVNVVLQVDRSMDDPTFLAECDRPCKTAGASTDAGGYRQSDYWSFTNPETLVAIVINAPRPLNSRVKVTWPIQSRDDQPIHIKQVIKTPPDILQGMLRNKR